MRPTSFLFLMTACLLYNAHLTWAEQHDLILTIKVSGGKPNKGLAILSLFTNQDNYLKAPVLKKVRPIDNKGNAHFTIEKIKAATYAVSVIYDEDGNNALNTGFIGIPTELVGFSNNAKGRFGPPSFERTSFKLAASKTIHIVFVGAKE